MIDRLIAESMAYDELKADFGPASVKGNFTMLPMGNLNMTPDLFGNGGTSRPMTEHAFRQMCQRLGSVAWPGSSRSLPATYLLTCPGALRSRNINHWIEETPENRKWFIREFDGTIRAVLTDRYSTVDITETLRWFDEALVSKQQDSVMLVRTAVTPDVMHVRAIFQDVNVGDGANYGVGAYVTNGEIGNRRLGVYPLIQRHACTNSIIIPSDQSSWDHFHVGNPVLLKQLFITSIFDVLQGSVNALEKLLLSLQQPMDNFVKHVDDLVAAKGWSIEARDKILIGTESNETLFGLVQGVSAAANAEEDLALQADMQMEAGRLLVGHGW
jgi:hypothetical protein